jgi:ABC-type multidrug transport system ATPase subunit
VTPVLVAESIGKRFDARALLTAATLRVDAGTVTLLLGRNGIGKSTLLKIAAGWIRPDYGAVHFRGQCYLPDRDLLSPTFSVREHLDCAVRRWGGTGLEEVLLMTGLQDCLAQRSSALSEGLRRRAELAIALVRRPVCLLADEPYRGLAPYGAETLSTVLRRMASARCGIVITGHEVPMLWSVADRVVWCTDGTTYDLGTPASAAEDWRFRREYLTVTTRVP